MAGLVVSILPMFYFYANSRDVILFNIIGIHQYRISRSFIDFLIEKIEFTRIILANPQNIILFYFIFLQCRYLKLDYKNILILGCFIFYVFTIMSMGYSHSQYFVCALSFLFFFLFRNIQSISKLFSSTSLVLLSLIYVMSGLLNLSNYKLIFPRPIDRLENIDKIVSFIKTNSSTNEKILSYYPGYAVWSKRFVPSGMENNFAQVYSKNFNLIASKLKVAKDEEIESWIRSRDYRIIILGSVANGYNNRDLEMLVENAGYKRQLSELPMIKTYLLE
jgi:hypothetical protein